MICTIIVIIIRSTRESEKARGDTAVRAQPCSLGLAARHRQRTPARTAAPR
jgi:hypothetical protein